MALSSTIKTGSPSSRGSSGSLWLRAVLGCTPSVTVNQNVLPTSWPAVDPDCAAHQLDQLGRDGQTEPRAAEPAGGRAVGLLERLEDRVQLLGGDADPRVGDRETEDDAVARRVPRGRRDTTISPCSVNLIALPTRLTRTWRSRPASPTSASGTSGATRQASSSPLEWARRARVCRVSSSASRREKGIGSRLSLPASILEKSRMSLMTVRSESAELLTRPRYSRCRGVKLGVEGQLGHADDAVHRRADLVAHVGEKLALGPAGGLGGLLGSP